jgi:hypothetical protein
MNAAHANARRMIRVGRLLAEVGHGDVITALEELKERKASPALPVPEPQLAAADRAPSTIQPDEQKGAL